MSRRRTDKAMKVNILVDFKENGIDKNEPHIVIGAENETAAAVMLKKALECKGYVVQAMCVVDGDYTLDELHAMAHYGIGMDLQKCRPLYISDEMLEYIYKLQSDPEEMRKAREEIERRVETR